MAFTVDGKAFDTATSVDFGGYRVNAVYWQLSSQTSAYVVSVSPEPLT